MSYAIEYEDENFRGLCEQMRLATCKFGKAGAKKLARRVKELESSPDEATLRQGPGSWHAIDHDWPGCLGAHLDAGATMIVQSIVTATGEPGWRVRCMGNCYKH
jgi:hypothetical protein